MPRGGVVPNAKSEKIGTEPGLSCLSFNMIRPPSGTLMLGDYTEKRILDTSAWNQLYDDTSRFNPIDVVSVPGINRSAPNQYLPHRIERAVLRLPR